MPKTRNEDPRIERTRQVVLEAAAELVGEFGFGRTTIEAVAERSGVARSTIYRHWPRRPDLLIEAIECHVGDMPDSDTGSLRNDLITIFTALGAGLSDPQLGAVVVSLMAEALRDKRFAALHTGLIERRRRHIEDAIERATQRGEIPSTVEAAQMAQDLSAPMFYRAFVTREAFDEAFIHSHIDRWIEIHVGC